MKSSILSIKQKKFSILLLVIILFLYVVLVLGSLVYKKWIASPNQQKIQSALILQQQFILTQTDAINTNWLRTLNPLVKNVKGRVVWSNILQKGLMEFVGLPKIANNQHYQLWIFDLVGEDSKPIYSTQFTEVSSDIILIPFSAKAQIKSPFKFELILKTDGVEVGEPLFLAQP